MQQIVTQHLRLRDDLSKIVELKSPDEAAVFRDRAVRVLWAIMEYVANTPIQVDGTVLVLQRLIFALNDLDRGARSPILNSKEVLNGRAPLTETHNRRAIVGATVKHLVKEGICKSESQAVKLISKETGVKIGSIKSDLTKSSHDANLNVLDPSVYSIPSQSNLDGIFCLIKALFIPKH